MSDWWDAVPKVSGSTTAEPSPATTTPESDWWAAVPKLSATQSAEPKASSIPKDVGLSIAQGLVEGVAAISPPGMLMNVAKLGASIPDFLYSQYAKTGTVDPSWQVPGAHKTLASMIPSSSDVVREIQDRVGLGYHDPESTAGKYAKTATEFASTAFDPMMAGRKAAVTIGGAIKDRLPAVAGWGSLGVTSELAGQTVEGTPFEAPARIAAPIVTDVLARKASPVFNNAMSAVSPTYAQKTAAKSVLASSDNPEALRQAAQDYTQNSAGTLPQTLQELTTDSGVVKVQQKLTQDALQGGATDDVFKRALEARKLGQAQGIKDTAQGGTASSVGDFIVQEFERRQAGVNNLGSFVGTGPTPDVIGSNMRQSLAEKAAQAKKAAGEKFDAAITPYNDYKVSLNPIKKFVNNTTAEITRGAAVSGSKYTPAEMEIVELVNSWKFGQKGALGDLRALDSKLFNLKNELQAQPGSAVALARINELRNEVKSTIRGAFDDIAEKETAVAATGKLPQEQTLLSQLQDLAKPLEVGNETSKTVARNGGQAGDRAVSTSRAGLYAGANDPASAKAGSVGSLPGATDLPGNSSKKVTPYDDANAQYAQYKQTFGQGEVGSVLERINGVPVVSDSAVGAKFFNQGNKSVDALANYKKAGGDIGQLRDYMLYDLRKTAVNNGQIDLARLDSWLNKQTVRGTLNVVPELQQDLQKLYQELGTKVDALHQIQRTKAAGFLNYVDPTIGMDRLMRSQNVNAELKNLHQLTKNDEAARQGTQRLLADYITTRRLTDLTDAKKMQQFLEQNREGLKAVFGGQGYNNLVRVNNNLFSAEKIGLVKKSPVTGYDALEEAIEKHPVATGASAGAVSAVASDVIAQQLPQVGGQLGLLLAAGGLLSGKLGKQQVHRLQAEMMYNPQFAHEAFQKIPDYLPQRQRLRMFNALRASMPSTLPLEQGAPTNE